MIRTSILPRPRKATNGHARPQLTSLVDMMVILLVFLLKSFSVEGQLVTTASDLELPRSTAVTAAEPELSLEVTTTGINLDGARVAGFPASAAMDSLVIAPLFDALVDLAMGDETQPITIQCDRRIDFAVLKRVLFTCNQAEYDNLSLLVLQEAL